MCECETRFGGRLSAIFIVGYSMVHGTWHVSMDTVGEHGYDLWRHCEFINGYGDNDGEDEIEI